MTNEEITSEEFFFNRIASGQAMADDYQELFSLMWRQHGNIVFNYAFSFLGNHEDARDVCQDTFLRAMQYLQKNSDRIPLKVNFRAWLRTITRNLITDRFRKPLMKRHASPEVLDTIPVEQSPEERAATNDDLEILRRCLSLLKGKGRVVLLLCDIEGLSRKEAAERTGDNANAVYVALHRARKSLRDCVALSWQN